MSVAKQSPDVPVEEWTLDTIHIGRRVLVFDQVGSTNTVAATHADETRDPGLVVIARSQTAGRGQFGRVWQGGTEQSLLMSVVLNPSPEVSSPPVLTAWAGVAVGDAVFALTGWQARIKWPNDLLIGGKKLCGVLIERERVVVAGIGLNLNQTEADFAELGLPDAVSLRTVRGAPVDFRTVAQIVIRQLDAEYCRLVSGERIGIEADWKWRTGLLGRPVEITLGGTELTRGRVLDLTFDNVVIELANGRTRELPLSAVKGLRRMSDF